MLCKSVASWLWKALRRRMFCNRVDNVAFVNVSGNCGVATVVIVIVGDVLHEGDLRQQ